MSSSSSSSSSLEDQLFRIFTHYAIHTDSSMPELWRSGTLLKFFKDCQLYAKDVLSSVKNVTQSSMIEKGSQLHKYDINEQDHRVKMTSADIDLELAKLIKSKNQNETSGHTKYNTSLSIEFSGFLILLQRFSRKCFPDAKPAIAFRKLLLENVFLLANRRFMLRNAYNIYNKEAREFLVTQQKSIASIFQYYLDIAEKRRNSVLAGKVTKLVSGNIDLTPGAADRSTSSEAKASSKEKTSSSSGDGADVIQSIQRLKSIAKSQRELLGYQEYLQFCMDFKLRSTSLITAVQTAEVFLEVVPYDSDMKGTKGMDFDGFQEAIFYISMIAFRQLNTSGSDASVYEITPLNKLKALLLFLWKAINGNDIAANMRKTAISSSSNLYGSAAFSGSFLSIWQKDGFLDYTSDTGIIRKSGIDVVDDITKFDFMFESFEDLTLTRVLSDAHTDSSSSDSNNNISIGGGTVKNGKAEFSGKDLVKLFRARPDLKEFVAIEIGNL